MKKISYLFAPILFIGLLFSGCDKDDDPDPDPTPDPDIVELINPVNKFIWEGLNHWYYYQPQVANLSDSKNNDTNSFNEYLNGYNTSESLFDALKYTSKDDFSWYIKDVDEQLNKFNGTTKSYGIGFGGLVQVSGQSNVIGYISYVSPNSPAADAGIKRGDIIYKVDGIVMDVDNYSVINNMFRNETVELGFATVSEGNIVTPTVDKSISAITLTTNPVHHSSVIEENGKKIGYLVYNGFRGTFNGELNDVFGLFKSRGVTELVLDLRYNGGGSVLSSALLSSMIYGDAPAESNNTIFAKLTYNNKRNVDNGSAYPFFDEVYLYDKISGEYKGTSPMNRLTNINRLYVITSEDTASASEMIINGLSPYMPVTTIGETTVGKNEGSITVVDASKGSENEPFTDIENRNKAHTVGMQPIVFQIFNSNDQNDYDNGFVPKKVVEEWRHYKNILPFGNTDEVMLRATLDDMLGLSSKSIASFKIDRSALKLKKNLHTSKFSKEMYIMPNEVNPFNWK